MPSLKDKFSSGHIFWEILTCFILALILNTKVVYNNDWDQCSIKINYDTCQKKPHKIKKVIVDGDKRWESISYDKLEKLKKYKNILIVLTNVWKIHPDILLVWEKEKYIEQNFYKNKFKPFLEHLYFSVNEDTLDNVICIHLRRGDLYNHTYNDGYNIEYYKTLIETIKSQTELPIHILTESVGKDTTFHLEQGGDKRELGEINHDDVEIFSKIEGVKLFRGDLSDFEQHFNKMCNSSHLILGLSSMSLIAGFINRGQIYVDSGYKKSRPNLFINIDLIPNFQVFKSPKEIKIKI